MKTGLHDNISKTRYILATSLPILLIIILAYSLTATFQNNINLSQKEIIGTHQLHSLFKLSGLVQKTRGLNQIFLRSNNNADELKQRINHYREHAKSSFNIILNDKTYSLNVRQYKNLTKLKQKFNNLDRRKEYTKHHFNEYSIIVEKIIDLMRDIAIHSNLILDDQIDTYNVGIIMMEYLPRFAEEIGKARGLVSAIPLKSTISILDNEKINNRVDAVLAAANRLEQDQYIVPENTKDTESNIPYLVSNLKDSAVTYSKIIMSRKHNKFSINTPQIIFEHGSDVINFAETLHLKMGEYFREKLNNRISNNRQYIYMSIVASLCAITIILLFGIYVYKLNDKNLSRLIKSRSMLKTILNTIPIGVYWKDLNGKYLGANKVYLDNIGIEKLEYIYGKNDDELNFIQGKVPSSIYDDEVLKTITPKHNKVVMAWPKGPELIDISRVPLLKQDDSVFGLLGVYQDITENQRQHDELLESESHYRYLIESASAVPWKFDLNTQRFTYVGPQVIKLLGHPIEEWYQRNFWSAHIHPDDRQQTIDYYMEQMDTKFEHEIEYRMCTKAGDYIWIRDNIRVQPASGTSNMLIGYMFDITDKKNSETALRLLATAFESQQAILITDKNKSILRVNEAFTKATGYKENEVLGENPKILSSGYHDNNFYAELWSTLEITGRWEGEIWNRRKNGEIYPQWSGITAVVNEDGLISHYVAVFNDLSERYETQAREKLILESISEAIFGVDNDGLCSFVNPACLNLLGYDSEQEVIGKNINELIHEPYCALEAQNSKLNDEKFHYSSETFWRKDGSNFPVEYWSQPIKRLDTVLGKVITFIDITERKLDENKLLGAKNESDKANLAKSEFLARMSHELRTPLNAILGFTQLLELDKSLTKSSQEFCGEVMKAGHHLLSLINDVLDLAKIEAGRINVDLKTIPLKDTINECASLIVPLAQQSNIELKYDTDSVKDILVEADPTRLTEVLLNLLSNAVKYNSEKGTIFLETKLKANNRLRISVTDTGEGLSETQQQMLFKPFERLGAECTQIEGTGIGLVISKHIIELMNGNIGVDSTTGKGSTFWVELDYMEASSDSETSSTLSSAENVIDFTATKNKTYDILYVEDNPSNIRLMEYLLDEFTFINLKVAITAEHALDILGEKEPDLMIFDIHLPGMNGFELLEKTKSIKKYKETPVFAISARAMTKDIESALALGFTHYITKPIDVPHFLHSLFESLGIQNKIKNKSHRK